MSRISTVFFDAGNTLINVSYETVARLVANGVTAAELAAAEPRMRFESNRHFLDGTILPETGDFFRFTFARLAELTGRPIDEAALARLRGETAVKTLWRDVEPSALAAVRRLRALGYRLAVISNADGRVAEILDEVGYAGLFEVVVDSGREGVTKPSPRIFRIALERMGVSAAESAYVGDFPVLDVLGAASVGMTPILYDPGEIFAAELPALAVRAPELRVLKHMDEIEAVLADLSTL